MADAESNVLDNYDLNVKGMSVNIQILQESDFVPNYEVTFSGIGTATKMLLLSLRGEIISMVPIDPSRIENEAYVEELNNKYIEASSILLDKYLPGTTSAARPRSMVPFFISAGIDQGFLPNFLIVIVLPFCDIG